MKVARKLTLALVAGVLVIMTGYGYVQTRREVVILDADLEKNAKFGRGLGAAIELIWARDGEARARELVETIDKNGPDVVQLQWHSLADLLARPPAFLSPEEIAGLAERTVVTRRENEAGEFVRHIYVPIAVPNEPPAVIEVIESLREEGRYIDMNRMQIAIATVLVAGMCGLIAMALGWWFVGRPVAQLRDRARAVGSGDFTARLSLRQHDEMGELAGELNVMSERLAATQARLAEETDARIATLDQLRHTDRLTTVGRLAAGIAHELGTPLNVIAGRAGKIVAAEGGQGPSAEFARIIQEQAARMTTVIRQLLDFSRRQGPKLGLCNVRMLAARTIDLLTPFAQKQGTTLHLAAPSALPLVHVDQNQIQQALANVIINGIQAMPGGGRLRVSIETAEARNPLDPGAEPGRYVRLAIEDQGQGIAAEDLPHIFEPFYTTKGVGEGTGLGLSVAHGIVCDHGGWIDVDSEVGRGTRVTLFLAAGEPGTAEAAS